jgi:hypothetical protein
MQMRSQFYAQDTLLLLPFKEDAGLVPRAGMDVLEKGKPILSPQNLSHNSSPIQLAL